MSSSARLAPVGIVERIETILARLPSDLLPAEDRAFLEQRALPLSELRRRRLDLRDDALRALAAHHTAPGSWPLARMISDELAIYVDRGSWRFDRHRGPPADPRRAAMYCAVRFTGNGLNSPSRRTVQRAIAGWRAQRKKIPEMR